MHTRRSLFALFSVLTILAMVFAAVPPRVVQAAPTELFISEYIEGSSFNKAIEIYNGTGAAVDLAAGGYQLLLHTNAAATPSQSMNLTGTLAAGDVFVAAHPDANATILAQADVTNNTVINWNGDDVIVLMKGSAVIDVFGQIGTDPGTEWGTGLTSTADNTLRRKSTIHAGDPDGSNVFDPALEWDGYANNTLDGLGAHTITEPGDTAPTVTAVTPVNNTDEVALDANLTVTFSEAVNLAADWFTLACTVSGSHTAVVSGGPAAYTLDPDTNFAANDVCTFTVVAANVTDVDTVEPPDAMEANYVSTFGTGTVCDDPYTLINAIQGNVEASPLTGNAVSIYGVVVGDYEGASPNLRGFYLQSLDSDQDADPQTSEGVFVFNANNNNVALGDVVRVSGMVEEYQGQTQIGSVTSVKVCASGQSVTPAVVSFPVASTTALEAYEGMLVSVPQEMTVTEIYLLGRFNQVLLSANGRLQNPTHAVEPGAPAIALQASNDLRKIILDDTLNSQNPDPIVFGRGGLPLSASNTLRGGDTVTGLSGVMTFTWSGNSASGNAYRIRPVSSAATINFVAANPRPVSPPTRVGNLRVANMNLLNYFNTFTGCTYGVGGGATDCRGAGNATEFSRQSAKTLAAILATEADIIGIGEIENDGYDVTSAIAVLVDQLNSATAAGTYAFIDADTATSQVNALGTDAIKVGFLYKPAVVTPQGVAVLNTSTFVNGGDGTARTRPALAVNFQHNLNGSSLTVVTNHFKSKGSACDAPDAGDGQGNCNGVRVNAATELVAWLATDPTGSGNSRTLIVGDLNSYAKEDPIDVILTAGYTNLIEQFGGPTAYSYVFDGQWGYLDHALATSSLVSRVLAVTEYHINSDEPSVLDYNTDFKSAAQISGLYAPDQYRMSDHDAVLIDLNMPSLPVAVDQAYTVNEGSTVQLVGVATDPGSLALTYQWDFDNDGVFDASGQQVSFRPADGPATHTVILRVTNNDGYSDTAQHVITVNNVAAMLGNITGLHNPGAVGVAVNASITFRDAGVLDTHTAVWDWGDGTTSSGVVTEMNGAGKATGSHSYATPGYYIVIVTLTDKDGASSTTATSVTIYQSFTMQARGKGSYFTPAGSYLSKPTKSGLTSFDFNSRVVKQINGRYSLVGYLYVQFRNGAMNFRSTKTIHMEIYPDGSAYILGQGSLNGKKDYTYQLLVDDNGANDTFQLTIFDDHGFIVYQTLAPISVYTGNIQIKK